METASTRPAAQRPPAEPRRPPTGDLGLAEVVSRALADNPLIGLQNARAAEAMAGVGVAESSLYPQMEVRGGAGGTMIGNYHASSGVGYWASQNRYLAGREDLGLSGRQLIFDFGATRAAVARAKSTYDSELFKVFDQAEDIAQKVTQAYLKVVEQRGLLREADDNATALQEIFRLVEENERNGHGTVADVKRVRARLLDAQTIKSDAEAELRNAADRFERLARVQPNGLRALPSLSWAIPRSTGDALALVASNNPKIAALDAAVQANRHEYESQRANMGPRVQLEVDVSGKDFRYNEPRTEVDMRAMVAARYKLFDGGQQRSELEQVGARLGQAEMRYRNDRDEVEADVRQYYQSLQAARAKSDKLKEAAADAEKARQLYDQQFKGGKRTLLELLEVQSAHYNARRAEITNQFDELRAIIGILRAVGNLTAAIVKRR